MKSDAHYYGVLAFSRACGFDKAHAWDVAYASQFVDDAKINKILLAREPDPQIRPFLKQVNRAWVLYDMATCHSYEKIKTFNYSSMVNNTVAFHFVPGCVGSNFPKKMRCIEKGGASGIMDSILSEVLDHGNLFELGIVLHAYADTYSHQGFSGLLSKVNDIDNWKIENRTGRLMDRIPTAARYLKKSFLNLIDEVLPAYGHAQALAYPDLPYLAWSYHYDPTDDFEDQLSPSRVIDNTARFKNAFKGIQAILKTFIDKHPQYRAPSPPTVPFDTLYNALIIKKSDKGRIRNWIRTMKAHGLFAPKDSMLNYDKHQWLRMAFTNFDKKKFSRRIVSHAVSADDFEHSKWFQYYKATHWYKDRFFACCKQAGVDIQR